MLQPSRSERAFIQNNVQASDPNNQIWISNIPSTWRHGYDSALKDIAQQAREALERDDLEMKDLYYFVKALAYGEDDASQRANSPVEAGWIPTKNGNYRKKIGGHQLVIFKKMDPTGQRIVWGYGIDNTYGDERLWPDWGEAASQANTALHALEEGIATAS